MTILGHDVNGRPLRAGDRAVLLSTRNPVFNGDIGRTFTVSSASRDYPGSLHCEEALSNGWPPEMYSIRPETLRRIDDRTDHQPSDFTFDSLMDHLKSGVPA